MKKLANKALAWIMTLTMILSMLPATAFAAEEGEAYVPVDGDVIFVPGIVKSGRTVEGYVVASENEAAPTPTEPTAIAVPEGSYEGGSGNTVSRGRFWTVADGVMVRVVGTYQGYSSSKTSYGDANYKYKFGVHDSIYAFTDATDTALASVTLANNSMHTGGNSSCMWVFDTACGSTSATASTRSNECFYLQYVADDAVIIDLTTATGTSDDPVDTVAELGRLAASGTAVVNVYVPDGAYADPKEVKEAQSTITALVAVDIHPDVSSAVTMGADDVVFVPGRAHQSSYAYGYILTSDEPAEKKLIYTGDGKSFGFNTASVATHRSYRTDVLWYVTSADAVSFIKGHYSTSTELPRYSYGIHDTFVSYDGTTLKVANATNHTSTANCPYSWGYPCGRTSSPVRGYECKASATLTENYVIIDARDDAEKPISTMDELQKMVAHGEVVMNLWGPAANTMSALIILEHVDPTDHDYVAGEVTAPTCTDKGYTAYTCSICGDVQLKDETAALGHAEQTSSTEATCTTGAVTTVTCSRCDYEKVTTGDPLGHDWDEGVEDPKATCTTDGTLTKTCQREGCEEVSTETVDALGHELEDVAAKEATPEENGYTAHKACTRCDYTEGKVETVYVPSHTCTPVLQAGQAATCDKDGYKAYYQCSDTECGKYYADEAGETEITDFETWKTGEGKIAAGHTYGELVEATEAVHTQTELKGAVAAHYYCAACDTYFTEAMEATNLDALTGEVPEHTYGTDYETDAENHWFECTVCGAEKDVTAHTYDGFVSETPGNCTTDGSKTMKCACGVENTQNTGKGNHTYGTLISAVEEKHTATELVAGVAAHYHCACGEYFDADKNATTLDALTGEVPEHTYGTDYETDAENHWFECTVCGAEKDVTAHTYDGFVSETPGNCTTDGSKTMKCACGVENTQNTGKGNHTYGTLISAVEEKHTATELVAGVAAHYHCACGEYFDADKNATTLEALTGEVPEHTYGDEYKSDETGHWTVCACGAETEHAAHTEQIVDGKDATCTESGLTAGKKCAVCDEVLVEQVIIPALDHAWDEGTVTTEPTEETEGVKTYTCKNDASHTKTESIPKLEHVHKYTAVVTNPTCLVGGYTTYTCSGCGDSYKDSETAALGHAYEGVETTAPTCEGKGVMTYTCKNDAAHTYTEEIDALGHKMVAGEVIAPTCTADGYTIYTCENGCGVTENREPTSATGHSYNAVVTEPTFEAQGYTTYTCPACGDSYVDNYVPTLVAVAQIGEAKFETLAAAVAAVPTDGTVTTITMVDDEVVSATVKIQAGQNIVLDLNGKTIDGTGKVRIALMSYGDLTIKDSSDANTGVIKAGIDKAGNTINVCAGSFTLESGSIYSLNNAILVDEEAADITIKGGKITAEPATKNSAALYVSSKTQTNITITGGSLEGYNGILLWNKNKLEMTGGSIEGKGGTGMQGNGTWDETEINISGDASVFGYYTAIYHPQNGVLNIADNATLTGWTGIVVKSGKVTISGGTISGTGAYNTYAPVSSGYTDTGDGLYVEHYDNSTNSENYGTPTVSVTGGTFTSVNGAAVASYANPNNASAGVAALEKFISGGSFNKAPDGKLAIEGYEFTENAEGSFGVTEARDYVAEVNGTKFETLAEALSAAQAGETVTLLADVNTSEIIVIDKAITLDGNGHTLTSSAGRAINVDCAGEVTIKGLTINASGERAINVIQQPVTLTIDNVTATAALYTVNVATSAGAAKINISNSNLTGLDVVNVYASDVNVTVTGGTLTVNDQTDVECYSALNLNKDISNSYITATGVTFVLEGDSTKAANSATSGTITIDGEEVGQVVAIIDYGNGAYYSFETLADAVAYASDGDTITLLNNVELTETLTVPADKQIIIDLNGKTVNYNSTNIGEAMISNKGDLTINDSVGTGVINYNYTGEADSSYGKGNYTIDNGGKLTVNGGKITIANLRAHAKYPINNNSTSGDAVLVINGGHLYNYNTAAIRQFCNSTTYQNSVTINGGLVEGYSAIWVQNPGKNTVSGNLTINGGEIRTTAAAYANGTSAVKDVSSKIYFSIDGEGGAWSETSAITITGGTFNENVYLAEEAPTAIQITENAATFNGRLELPVKAVAMIGETEYESLTEAVEAAQAGDTIVVLTDIELTETLTVPADKQITIDLNGKTISQTKAQTAGYQMILNDGNLTIDDSVGGGKISYTDSGNGGEYISDTIYNRGTLTINGGTIENLSSATVASNGYPHAVDTYSGIRDTSVTINDGTIYCAEYSAIRMFCVSATYKADLTINGGTIKGAIDMQNGTKNAALGTLTINDGTFQTTKNANNIRFANWNGGATEYGITAAVKGGTFNGGITTQYVPTAANWNSKIISGGAFTVEPAAELAAEGFTFAKNSVTGTYGVGVLPDADVTNLGTITVVEDDGDGVFENEFNGSYYIYDLINGGKMTTATAPFDLTIAMDFTAKDTAEQAAANAFGDYTTDFYITMDGMANGSFVGDGCYLAGYYASYGTWVLIPLDGFTVEDGKAYPVITSAGFDFSYKAICSDVEQFICGIYITPEILAANPNLTVDLALGLSENVDAALAADFITVDNYVYDADDLMPAEPVAQIGEETYATLAEAVEAAQAGDTIVVLTDIELTETLTVPAGKQITIDLNGKAVSMNDASGTSAQAIKNEGNLTIKDGSAEQTGKITFVSTTPSSNYAYSTSTIINKGNLTVESGTVENTTVGGASYAIDTAWYNQDVSLTINGGTIVASQIAVRQVPYSTTYKNVVNVTGGTLTGATAGLQVHHTSSTATNLSEVNITGGTFNGSYAFYTSYYTATASAGTDIKISGGTFNGYLFLYNGNVGSAEYPMNVEVTGGTFNSEVYIYCMGDTSETYEYLPVISGGTYTSDVSYCCAEGYICEENENGTYSVVEIDYYVITVNSVTGGTVVVDKEQADAGDTITVTAAADEGYVFRGITVDGNVIEGNTFTVTGNHEVSAIFTPLTLFAGATVSMTEVLDLNFVFNKAALTDVTGAYAILTGPSAGGRDYAETVTIRVEQADWLTNGDSYYKIPYTGLAAKQMSEEITITLYDSNGTVLSETYTDSIRNYAMRAVAHAEAGTYMKRLAVDMLNYGAAAQTEFGYKTDALANNLLTAEQQALGTAQTAAYADRSDKILAYSGCSFNLEDKIEMNMYFPKKEVTTTENTRVVVKFTHHDATEETVLDLDASALRITTNYAIMTIDELVVADGRQLVTCELYEGETLIAKGVDSLESYVARAVAVSSDNLWMEKILNFSDSAYDYLRNR